MKYIPMSPSVLIQVTENPWDLKCYWILLITFLSNLEKRAGFKVL